MKTTLQVLLINLVFYSVSLAQFTEAPTGEGDLDRAIALYGQKDYQGAHDVLLTLCESGEDDGLASQLLGKSLYNLKNFDDALKWLETSLKINDKDPETHVWMSWVYGEYLNDAGMFAAISLSKKFRKSLNTALELDPDNYWAHIGMMHYYEEAPAIAGGSFKKAEEHAKSAKDTDVLRGSSELADLYIRDEKYVKAQVVMERLSEAYPEMPEPRVSVLAIKLQANELTDWLAAYERFEKSFGDNLAAQYQFGKYAAMTGKELDRAEQFLKHYLNEKEGPGRPTYAGAWWRLGMILEHKQEQKAAYKAYNEAIFLDSENPAIHKSWETLGITLGMIDKK